MASSVHRRSVIDLLSDAERLIERLAPADAHAETQAGALLVDVRSEVCRSRDGVVPGALHVPLTVLPWRFEPDGGSRSPWAPGPDARVIVMCDHGYSSVLAAATLAQLGFAHAADVVGGYQAWMDAGLPTAAGPTPTAIEPTGMGPPD